MHLLWCISGSLTGGFLWCRWWGKCSWHSRRRRNPKFYVSGKRPMTPLWSSHPTVWWSLRCWGRASCCRPAQCSCSQSTRRLRARQTCTNVCRSRWRLLRHGSVTTGCRQSWGETDTLYSIVRPQQNGCQFAENISNAFAPSEEVWNSFNISLKFVPIRIKSVWVHGMTWHQTGDKPLPEPMMTKFYDIIWHH